MCSYTLFFFFFFLQKALNCQAPGELFTADLLMAQGVQTMTSIISILKYTQAYIHLHKITEETRANANTVARVRIYSAGTSHKRIRRENIYFRSLTCHIGYSSNPPAEVCWFVKNWGENFLLWFLDVAWKIKCDPTVTSRWLPSVMHPHRRSFMH